jgi:hypothetical protein
MIDIRYDWTRLWRGLSPGLVLLAMAAAAGRDDDLVLMCFLPGAAMVIRAVGHALIRAPELRATPGGLSFRGDAKIPWDEIDTIYDASDPAPDDRGPRGRAICVPFHRRRTVLELPITMWPLALRRKRVKLSVGGVPAQLVRELEVMRGAFLSASTAAQRTMDAAELPAARLRRR